MALTDKLTAIGDAIRSKTGGSDLLTLDEMPQEIQSIQTGGGGDTALADSIIDGTITSYSSDSLTEVTGYGLSRLSDLVEVSLSNVETVGNYAISNDEKLSSLSIPKVKSIGNNTINYVDIESFDCPELEYIGDYALRHCDSLTTLNIPNVETIGTSSIAAGGSNSICNCSSLESIVLKKVEVVSGGIGYQCPKLKSADLYIATSVGAIFRSSPNFETLIIRTQDVVCSAAAGSLLQGTKIAGGTGYIYVPAALIEDYKVATNWTKYASQFRAIEDYPEICGDGGEA